MTSCSYLGM